MFVRAETHAHLVEYNKKTMNEIKDLNQALFQRINGEIDTPTWVVDMAIVMADYLIYALSAYPFGKVSYHMSHKTLLAPGLIVLIAANLVLATNDHEGVVLAGLLWDQLGASFTFYAGATFCVVTLVGLAWQPVMQVVKA